MSRILRYRESSHAQILLTTEAPVEIPQFDIPKPPASTPELTVAAVLGEIDWLLTQSQNYRNLFLSDLEWFVMAPVLQGQFRIFHAEGKPVGVAFWGYLGEEAEARLKSGAGRLAPEDWKSGDRCWLVELIAPFGKAEIFLDDLRKTALATETFKFHFTTPDGKRTVKTVKGEKA